MRELEPGAGKSGGEISTLVNNLRRHWLSKKPPYDEAPIRSMKSVCVFGKFGTVKTVCMRNAGRRSGQLLTVCRCHANEKQTLLEAEHK